MGIFSIMIPTILIKFDLFVDSFVPYIGNVSLQLRKLFVIKQFFTFSLF